MNPLTMLVGVLVLAISAPAFAQDHRTFDASGGYSFLSDQTTERNFHGWVASAAGYFNRRFGIAGEVDGHYNTVVLRVFPWIGPVEGDYSFHSFMAGPRFIFGQNRRSSPFFQVLFGGARKSTRIDALDISGSSTQLSLQFGGGVDVWTGRSLGIGVGSDLRIVGLGATQLRIQAGVVMRR